MQAKIFPGLRKPMILGIPWLKKVNPQIDWAQELVVIKKGQEMVSLPLAHRKDKGEVNMVSAKQFCRLLRKGKRAFVGFVRKVVEHEECNVVETGDVTHDLDSVLQSPKLPEPVKGVLREFADVFPADLPVGKPPVRKGHEFRIDLEDDVPPIHRPLYKMSPLELDETKKQIEYLLEHEFI